jgi:hypothetical protein
LRSLAALGATYEGQYLTGAQLSSGLAQLAFGQLGPWGWGISQASWPIDIDKRSWLNCIQCLAALCREPWFMLGVGTQASVLGWVSCQIQARQAVRCGSWGFVGILFVLRG